MADRWQLREQLERELRALGEPAMLVEEFDGLVAGLLVCPELVMPGEWLQVVWGADPGDETQAPFDDLDHANRVFALLKDYYNDVALTLVHRERYHPLFLIDREEVLWEIWVEGFAQAVYLRPDAWQQLLDADDTRDAMRGLLALIGMVTDSKGLPQGLVDEMTERAPDLIPGWIETLNAHRLANYRPPAIVADDAEQPPSMPRPNVGRNEPCPCGSGKKYKRCCGLN